MSYTMLEIIDHFNPLISSFNQIFPIDDLSSDVTDLLQIEETTPFRSSTRKRVTNRVNSPESHLKAISDRVSSLESRLDQLLVQKEREKKLNEVRRKYKWTAEIKGRGVGERKYTWTAEIEGDDVKKEKKGVKKYEWRSEIKKDDDVKKTYTWQATIGGDKKDKKKKEKKKEEKKKSENGACAPRIVEIDDDDDDDDHDVEEHSNDHRALILRKAYAKRAGRDKDKTTELSPQDAAAYIQTTFKAYLIRRSQTLRSLRELAISKTKLKELRSSFHNFSFRTRISRDAEERQKFSEKIIVLLLTVDAIEGVDMMVRSAKRSMVDELEAMLDVVDPQPTGKALSMKRRTFDVPSGAIQKEIAEGVAEVVQMLNEDNAAF
ncbi:hypothetical protein RND81_12G123100 [Saponaria officinalis]|uniref:BAG domain-containing protein n=1 Tax=Saponaria officinalis TaxID=3572 RepID=A0AAW1H9N4_SAPOF